MIHCSLSQTQICTSTWLEYLGIDKRWIILEIRRFPSFTINLFLSSVMVENGLADEEAETGTKKRTLHNCPAVAMSFKKLSTFSVSSSVSSVTSYLNSYVVATACFYLGALCPNDKNWPAFYCFCLPSQKSCIWTIPCTHPSVMYKV